MLKSPVEMRPSETAKPVRMDQRLGQAASVGGRVGFTRAHTRAPQPRAEPGVFVQRQLEIGVKLED